MRIKFPSSEWSDIVGQLDIDGDGNEQVLARSGDPGPGHRDRACARNRRGTSRFPHLVAEHWPGMTESSSSGHATDAATGACYPVYAMHHAAPNQDNYDPYTGRSAPDPQASPMDGPGQFIRRTR
jgi:hypothetical protein